MTDLFIKVHDLYNQPSTIPSIFLWLFITFIYSYKVKNSTKYNFYHPKHKTNIGKFSIQELCLTALKQLPTPDQFKNFQGPVSTKPGLTISISCDTLSCPTFNIKKMLATLAMCYYGGDCIGCSETSDQSKTPVQSKCGIHGSEWNTVRNDTHCYVAMATL